MVREVAIAGGGLVGRMLAIALASQTHLKVTLYTGPEPDDVRATAVALAGRRLLARTGVWPLVAAQAEPIVEMTITDSAAEDLVRPEVLHFAADREMGAFAHMIFNADLRRATRIRSGALPIEEVAVPVVTYDEAERGVTLRLADGSTRWAEVLIAADGSGSTLREIAGIGVVEVAFNQAGIVGTVSHAAPHNSRAVQHFLPNGPFAMLPLPGSQSSIVWTERPEFAETLTEMDPMVAALEIERVFGLSLGRLCPEGPLMAHPLRQRVVRAWTVGRLAIAGDAAHQIHPLAGQGFNLGLRDVAVLAEELADAHRNGEDLALALPRYERRRRADTAQMAITTRALNAAFSVASPLARTVRSVALGLVNERSGLKAIFMREAAGLAGDVPRLMRGEAL